MKAITIQVRDKEIPLISLSYEDLEKVIEDWRIAGITDPLGQLIAWLRDQVAGLIGALRDAVLGALNTLGSSITSAVSGAISTITSAISSGINSLLNSLSSALSSLGEGIRNALMTAFNTLSSTLSSAITAVRDALSSAVSTIANTISGILSTIASTLSALASTITAAISQVASTIISAITGVVNAVANAISGVASTITSALGTLASSIMGALNALASSIIAALSSLTQQLRALLSSLANSIIQTISNVVSTVADALASLGRGIAESFVNAFSALTSTLMSIFSNIVAGLREISVVFQGFVNSIARLGDIIAGPLKGIADALAGFFKDPIGALAKALGDAWAAFVEFTKPVWEPIMKFIDFIAKTVWEQISNFIKLISDGLQEFLKDPLGFITRQLSALWSGFIEFTRPIWEPIQQVLENIGKFFKDAWDNFIKGLSDAWNSFVELTRPIWEPIQDFFDKISKGFAEFLKDPLGFITSQLTTLWSGFVEFTKPIWEPIKDFVEDTSSFFTDLAKTLSDWSGAIVKFINEDIPNFFTRDLPKFLTEDLPNMLVEIGKHLLASLQQLGEAIFGALKLFSELLLKAVVALFDVGKAIMGGAINNMIMPIMASIKEAVKPASPPPEVKEFVQLLKDTFQHQLDLFYNKVKSHEQVGGEVVATASNLASTFGLIYVSAQLGGLIADAVHPLKNFQIRKTIKSVIDNFGGFFIMSSLSASFTFSVLHPLLRRFFQKMFSPVLPGPDTLTAMFFRRTFDEEYYTTHMRELGYAPTFIKGFIDVNANIPTVQQMIRLVGAQKVEKEVALRQLRAAGWIGERGWLGPDVVFEGLKDPPPLLTAIQMHWMGLIDLADLKKIYMWHGRHEDYFEKEVFSHYKIPPVTDLITFVIREVLDPEDFRTLLLKQGYPPKEQIRELLGRPLTTPLIGGGIGEGDWADAYWEAHWRLPSPENVFEFYNRAVAGMVAVDGKPLKIDQALAEKIVMAYTTLHDYKPEPRKLTGFLKQKVGIDAIPVGDEALVRSLRYRILTRIESRFVRRWGLISTSDYMRLGIAQGIDPFIKIRTLSGSEITMLDALTTAEFLQDLLEERTGLRTQIINAYVRGFNIKTRVTYVADQPGVTEEREIETLKLGEALSILRFRPEEISWLMAQAFIRRVSEIREDNIKAVIEDYTAGLIKPAEFENELKGLIDDDDVRKTLIDFYTRRRIRQRIKRMHARLERDLLRELDTHLRLYENGFTTKDNVKKLMDDLVAKELLQPEERDLLLSISETRRTRELIELAIRALARKVARAEITPEKFMDEMKKLGVDDSFAEKMLEVHAPFHTLTVASLISYADEVPIPPDLLRKKLTALRVPEDEAKIIEAVIARRPLTDEIRSMGSILQSLARDLEISPGEAASVLQGLNLTSPEIELRKQIIERLNRLALRRQIRRTLDVLLREQYEAMSKGRNPGLITLEQYIKIYKAMGFPDDYIVARAQEILANFKIVIDQWHILKSRLEGGR